MTHKSYSFEVQNFKDWVNQQLKRTDNFANDKFKAGLCTALEHVLHESGKYKGYTDNYWIEKGCKDWDAAGQPDFPAKEEFIYGPTGQRYNRYYY